jgi:hypothetical protein
VLAQPHPSQFRLNCSQKGKSCPERTLENLKKKIDPPSGGKERKKEKSKKG